MELGAFSISLAVKDLEASKTFYEKFGSRPSPEMLHRKWPILKNGSHVIGLFQGMFEKNILTFNPGWDRWTGFGLIERSRVRGLVSTRPAANAHMSCKAASTDR
jgi:hypothetical protein